MNTNNFEKLYLAEKQRNEDLMTDILSLNRENEELKELFKKDFEEIALYSKEFSTKYENFLLRIGEIMVTQRAYKELSIQLGEKLGHSIESIRVMASALELDVLNNQNDRKHHTNIKDTSLISSISSKLLKRFNKKNR